MIILGIDPGLKATGYGVISFKNHQLKILEAGAIEPKQKDLLQNRIQKIHQHLSEIIAQYKPDVMVLEKLYAHHKHPMTASKLGHARGVICLLCAQHQISLVEYSVKRIRQAIVGNGNATKLQTQFAVAQILKIDQQKLTLDASDALALGLGYTHILRKSI